MAGRRGIEDVYPLSPIQTLFYSANPGAVLSVFDQWHCTLGGELNVSAFQRAWQETLQRHAILRSTIHGDGLPEPMQVVHRDVQLPWTIEDWRSTPSKEQAARWTTFLRQDRAHTAELDGSAGDALCASPFGRGQVEVLVERPGLVARRLVVAAGLPRRQPPV